MSEPRPPAPDSAALGLTFTRYLSDEIPPMLFAGSATELARARRLRRPPCAAGSAPSTAAANPCRWWTTCFTRRARSRSFAELELVPSETVAEFLTALVPMLVEICPAPDRERLLASLRNLHQAETVAATAVEIIHRPADAAAVAERPLGSAAGAAPPAAAVAPPVAGAAPPGTALNADDLSRVAEAVEGLSRLSLLLQRLPAPPSGPQQGATPVAPPAQAALIAEIVAEVAASARTQHELVGQLNALRQLGLPLAGGGLFPLLSSHLPDWAAPTAASLPASAPLTAMRHLVELARDSGESRSRFSELVRVAIDEFNRGSLGRAVTLLDLAERMIADREVDGADANSAIAQAYSSLDQAQLRRLVETEERLPLLRRVLVFFPPSGSRSCCSSSRWRRNGTDAACSSRSSRRTVRAPAKRRSERSATA